MFFKQKDDPNNSHGPVMLDSIIFQSMGSFNKTADEDGVRVLELKVERLTHILAQLSIYLPEKAQRGLAEKMGYEYSHDALDIRTTSTLLPDKPASSALSGKAQRVYRKDFEGNANGTGGRTISNCRLATAISNSVQEAQQTPDKSLEHVLVERIDRLMTIVQVIAEQLSVQGRDEVAARLGYTPILDLG